MKNRKKLMVVGGVLALALLCTLGVLASPVALDDAQYAAHRWATSGAVLQRSIGQRVVAGETLQATNGVTLHVVRFDGGTAFVSSDTELEPIIAFTTATNFSAMADSPLWRLLKRDTIVRHAALQLSRAVNLKTATASAGFTAQMAVATAAADSKWAALLDGRRAQANILSLGATIPNKLDGVSDVRCAPLVQSQWSQTTDDHSWTTHNCYNIYTPNHDPCGCTATAMSQIMRYYAYPTNSVDAKTYVCTVDGDSVNLTMQGGVYEWDKMTLCPKTSAYDEASWNAIGKLTSDVGIALKSDYASSGTGSVLPRASDAFKAAFGYANAVALFKLDVIEEAYYGDGRVDSNVGLHNLAVREKVIYANLDAKCPVEFAVYGYEDAQIGKMSEWAGHAIVGDGYGYSEYGGEQVPYVHINLGWHGVDDAWYNIPEIHSPSTGSYIGSKGTTFTVLAGAAYNLFPTNTGNIVAGRVYDISEEPLEGLAMTICAAGTSEVLAEAKTDAKGIYSFIVPGGADYDITCSDSVRGRTETHTVSVPRETMEKSDENGTYTELDANVGNYWGHDADFEMGDPTVQINSGTLYTTLDKALEAVTFGDTVKILRTTRLKKSVTIPDQCTIVAEPVAAGTPVVKCTEGATITVTRNAYDEEVPVEIDGIAFTNVFAGFVVEDGGSLAVRNGSSFETLEEVFVGAGGRVEFSDVALGALPSVAVAEGGTNGFANVQIAGAATYEWLVEGELSLASTQLGTNQFVAVTETGHLRLGAGNTHLTQLTFDAASADGLTLAGALTETISVYASDAWQKNTVFGRYDAAVLDEDAARESAKFFVDALDEDGDLGGNVNAADKTLYWGHIDWSRAQGVGAVMVGCVTSYYTRVNTLLKNICDGTLDPAVPVDVVLYKDATCPGVTEEQLRITSTHTLTTPVRLTSEVSGDPSVAQDAVTVSFGANGGFLITNNMSLVVTNLVLSGAGATLANCAFQVRGGELTLEDGAVLSEIQNGKGTFGGAIMVTSGRVTTRSGSRIENCRGNANTSRGGGAIALGGSAAVADLFGGTITGCSAVLGGGVYACMNARVNVAGDFEATDNTTLDGETTSNLYLEPGVAFTLADALTGDVGVSFGTTTPDLNATNANFIALGCELAAQALTNSAACFAHDVHTNLVGGCVDGQIVWTERPPDDGQCDPSEASYMVVLNEGTADEEVRYYEWIEDAFDHIDADVTVYCAEGDWLGRDIEIRYAVRLVSFMPEYRGKQTIQRLDDAQVRIVEGGSLTLEDVRFSGLSGYTDWYPHYYENNSTKGLFAVDGGSLTLDSGAIVGPVEGSASRAANAISVYNGGTLTMLSGSTVCNSYNAYSNVTDATGCGGGVLLDNATAHFKGGLIKYCAAYRAGAVAVANCSTAYVSGNFTAIDNYDLTNGYDCIVVSRNSNLVLAGELTGMVGVNEGIACDTNCFGTVSTNWAWTVDTLTNSAARFFHDKRYPVCGTAVTNAAGQAVLVWSDWLSKAGRYVDADGKDYRIFLAPGQMVAAPKAFSVNQKTSSSGRMVLALEGGVEGCWYTVYSTEDLTKPFVPEASVQLRVGEAFEYEIDRTKSAKYYKIVAEEGIR